jgi:hypothetical protein
MVYFRILLIAILLFALRDANAQTTNYEAYSLFVMNIAKYSSWPNTTGELRIAVLGKSKIYDHLQKQAGSKQFNGLSLKVSQAEHVSEVGDVHIIYVSDGKSSALQDIVKSTQGKPVIIIAEREGLFKKGAGFSFIVTDNNTLRFDINSSDLEKRNIKIAKNLSALANSVM